MMDLLVAVIALLCANELGIPYQNDFNLHLLLARYGSLAGVKKKCNTTSKQKAVVETF